MQVEKTLFKTCIIVDGRRSYEWDYYRSDLRRLAKDLNIQLGRNQPYTFKKERVFKIPEGTNNFRLEGKWGKASFTIQRLYYDYRHGIKTFSEMEAIKKAIKKAS